MNYELQKGTYLVVGLGITGESVLDFLNRKQIPWIAFDEGDAQKFKGLVAKHQRPGCRFYFGALPKDAADGVVAALVSPGVPLNKEWARELRGKSIPLLGEMELASRFLSGKMIAVTGTNGKSTTVSLIHAMLQEGGISSALKGNIGSPLLTAAEEPAKDAYVVEVSSYQLETIETFHPHISVVMNVTPDHLERYDGMDGYAAAKEKIALNQTASDFFIYNADDRYCSAMARRVKAKAVPFSLVNHFDFGGFTDRNEIVVRVNEKEERYDLAECSLMGIHNQENMLVAAIAATLAGVKRDAIARALKSFKALPHRLEDVGTFNGIRFFDDSKGTNVGSVVMSLASFEKNVLLILGGRDKGGDYAPLLPLIRHKVKALVLLGEAREKIAASLKGAQPTHIVETMKEAVDAACRLAAPGDTVLLSPACSSFDQYRNYAERGRDFADCVRRYWEGGSRAANR